MRLGQEVQAVLHRRETGRGVNGLGVAPRRSEGAAMVNTGRGPAHILVGTDFSASSHAALDAALTLAERVGARVTILHAYQNPGLGLIYPDAFLWPEDEIVSAARAGLEQDVREAKRRWPETEGMLVRGEVWEELLRAAAERDADLLVVGAHGRRGLSRALLGSVAEKVVRMSPIPVLTVKRHEAAA
jgi:nucleotide-binding universal stress UspA family protein